jgi:glutamate dehydrogenase
MVMDSVKVDDLIGEVERLAEDRGIEDREALAALAESFAARVPPVIEQDPATIPARIVSLFEFILERDRASKVRVFTPTMETHGYESGGSVVEVCTGDSPFLLDSISNEIERHEVKVVGVVHPVLGVERDAGGRLQAIRHARHSITRESVEHYQLGLVLDATRAEEVAAGVTRVLADVRVAVADFHQMRAKLDRMIELTRIGGSAYSQEEVDEGVSLLEWLDDDNFVFLGYREYRLIGGGEDRAVQVVPDTGLGILRDDSRSTVHHPVPLKDLPPDRAARYIEGDLVVVTKTNQRSPIHRTAKMDYIGVRIMGPDGRTAGEARMVGLFTSKAYMQPASETPMLRRKLHDILLAEDLIEGSHDHKAMIELFETFSKHDLFAASTEELLGVLSGLLTLQERDNVKLFIRPDTLHRSVSILVALPRDRFNAGLRQDLQEMFLEEFGGTSIDYHLALGDSDPAQIHFTVWVPEVTDYDFEHLESQVVAMTRSWEERLLGSLLESLDRQEARELARKWAGRFPDYYSASTPIEIAATDMIRVAALATSGAPMSVGLQNEVDGKGEQLTRIALYRAGGKRPLSELLPALEDLGLTVIEEIPSRISGPGDYFIHDFGVLRPDGSQIDVEASSGRIVETLEGVWRDGAESDDLNRLVVSTTLGPRDVDILRAYRTYWRRVAPIFTLAYVNDTLAAHPELAELLVELFAERFDPDREGTHYGEIRNAVLAGLDRIPSIEEDRIIRAFFELIEATVRTNFYQSDRPALAFKLVSKEVPDAPLPHPLYEIFVLGPTVEGIHLRGGMVARGGLRWSTRREDYRTEVLDLMKAQMTKNAVIVPTGAKGGFVLRNPPDDPVALRAEVETQYRLFIGALLDVTDNRVDGEIVRPERVRAHDADDPYLVVAADKGTATFSDVANSIAMERGFWLGDAFASGGSTGYDHKALGITARGAWESLERHFSELGIDPFGETFTVVGIGDMSGDVFGNGMLGSNQMRLVAAFDHRHIFIDPEPDPGVSFIERRRLFELPRSSWDDYDRTLISEGGGVFARTEKSITISEAAREAIGAHTNSFTPNQLISAILKAPVDLLWNGGIGTYVKAASETHQQVGDRTNDAVRVDGADLRCRVVVEGGNLGLTQRARIEYAENGGKINTDFIDNSGGVDCSDREVNLKILLDGQVAAGVMTGEERNTLIADVSDEVVDRILSDNFHQAQAISREVEASPRRMYAYEDLMESLEAEGILDRHIDAMPSSEAMSERMKSAIGLTRPEMAVLLANAKRSIKQALVGSVLMDDPYLLADVEHYFPQAVTGRLNDAVDGHPLRRELIATLLANDIVNSEGVVFMSRLVTQTGAEPVDVVRAYRIARDLTGAQERWANIEQIHAEVDGELWARLMRHTDRMVASVTRWYLANGNGGSIGDIVESSRPVFEEMEAGALDSEVAGWRDNRIAVMQELIAAGVPEGVARSHAVLPILNYGPDVIEISQQSGQSASDTLHAFLQVGQAFGLDRMTDWARSKQIDDRWDRWALWTIEEELLMVRRRAVERAFMDAGARTGVDAVDAFMASRASHVARLVRFMRQIDTTGDVDIAQLMVAIRQARAAIA